MKPEDHSSLMNHWASNVPRTWPSLQPATGGENTGRSRTSGTTAQSLLLRGLGACLANRCSERLNDHPMGSAFG